MIYNKNTVLKFIHDALKPKFKKCTEYFATFHILLVKTSHHALIQSNILITLVLSNFICFNLATIYESPVQNICVYILKFIGKRNVRVQMHA